MTSTAKAMIAFRANPGLTTAEAFHYAYHEQLPETGISGVIADAQELRDLPNSIFVISSACQDGHAGFIMFPDESILAVTANRIKAYRKF